MIARTKKKIPQISEGIFGLLVQSIFSPGMTKFDYATPDRFVNMLKIGLKNTKKYFWIANDRIYVTNPDIEKINIVAYFDEDLNPDDFNDCATKPSENSCVNPIDKDFPIPSYLEKSLIDMVNETLSKTYFRHLIDETPNNKDEEKS